MASRRSGFAVLAVLGVLLAQPAVGPACLATDPDRAGEDTGGKDERREAREKADGADEGTSAVFTNEDLERMFGATRPAAAPGETAEGEGEAPPSALEQMEKKRAGKRERAKAIAEAEKEVAGLEAQIRELEKRLLAVSNPFLARPKVSDEEKAEWKGKNAIERRALTRKQIDERRKELEEARRKLAKLRSG